MKKLLKLIRDFNNFLSIVEEGRMKSMYFTGQGKV
jgi:hypothetical protein